MTAQLRIIAKCLANAITHHRITPINLLLNAVTLCHVLSTACWSLTVLIAAAVAGDCGYHLHSMDLQFTHPATGAELLVTAPIPLALQRPDGS